MSRSDVLHTMYIYTFPVEIEAIGNRNCKLSFCDLYKQNVYYLLITSQPVTREFHANCSFVAIVICHRNVKDSSHV